MNPTPTSQRPHAQTLSQALRRLQQAERLDTPRDVAQYLEADALQQAAIDEAPAPAHSVPLNTRVRLTTGVYGVVTGHSTADGRRYRVSYWSAHFWAQRHVWCDETAFEVVK